MDLVDDMGSKIVQRDDGGDDGSECGGNLRIADIANVLLAFNLEVVDFRFEGLANLGGGARKINEHAAGINHVDAETVFFFKQKTAYEIGFRQAETFAEFLRSQPMMKVGRTVGVEFIEELLEGLFLFGRALQL